MKLRSFELTEKKHSNSNSVRSDFAPLLSHQTIF